MKAKKLKELLSTMPDDADFIIDVSYGYEFWALVVTSEDIYQLEDRDLCPTTDYFEWTKYKQSYKNYKQLK